MKTAEIVPMSLNLSNSFVPNCNSPKNAVDNRWSVAEPHSKAQEENEAICICGRYWWRIRTPLSWWRTQCLQQSCLVPPSPSRKGWRAVLLYRTERCSLFDMGLGSYEIWQMCRESLTFTQKRWKYGLWFCCWNRLRLLTITRWCARLQATPSRRMFDSSQLLTQRSCSMHLRAPVPSKRY
jgi:hypothetical protein